MSNKNEMIFKSKKFKDAHFKSKRFKDAQKNLEKIEDIIKPFSIKKKKKDYFNEKKIWIDYNSFFNIRRREKKP